MADPSHCVRCGTEVVEGLSADGVCPNCLLTLGLASTDLPPDEQPTISATPVSAGRSVQGQLLSSGQTFGTVPQRGDPDFDRSEGVAPGFASAPVETDTIETATLVENPFVMIGGKRNAIDEHTFNPMHARVTVGARVRFLNNGEMAHTIAARDGSWTTGELQPRRWEYVTFDRPGTFLYHCTDHPWAIGEITIEEDK